MLPTQPGPASNPVAPATKKILYFTPTPANPDRFFNGCTPVPKRAPFRPQKIVRLPERADRAEPRFELTWITRQNAAAVSSLLEREFIHLIVIDLRFGDDVRTSYASFLEAARGLLDRLEAQERTEPLYSFHRILTLVSGPDEEAVDRLIAELGARGVGRVLRQRSGLEAGEFRQRVMDEIHYLLHEHRPGKVALCASGGGTTGVFFELGVLKCLEDCFANRTANDFDMYFGISAGAVVSGVLASGYSVLEFMAAIAGEQFGRLPPIDLRLLQLRHLNYADIAQRTSECMRQLAKDLASCVTGQLWPSFDEFLMTYADLIGAPFRSETFESALRLALEQPGMTNDFRALERELFIGATDHDAREHVLFGAAGTEHVPISKAIQASFSFNPVFTPVEIDGREYVDGAITRTSEFVEAIQRGADLIFVLDPFVPYVAKPGVRGHRPGILYNIEQDIRTISYTRFENARHWVLRQFPEVSCYTFVPSNTLRGVMGSNPMDSRHYLRIWQGAYLSTFQRIRQIEHRLRGDATAHGIEIDTRPAEEVVARLQHVSSDLCFQDFLRDEHDRGPVRKAPVESRRDPRPAAQVSA